MSGPHRAPERINAHGMLVLPAVSMLMCIFAILGRIIRKTGRAAPRGSGGGITTVVDQPNTDPRTLDARSFELKLDLARSRSVVTIASTGPGRIEDLRKAGAQALGEIFSYEHSDQDCCVSWRRRSAWGCWPRFMPKTD